MTASVINHGDLLRMSEADVMSLSDGRYTVKFPNGKVKTTKRRLAIAFQTWEINRHFNVALQPDQILPIQDFRAGDDAKLLVSAIDAVYYGYVEDHPDESPRDIYDTILMLSMKAKNMLYNFSAIHLNKYVNGLSYLDFAHLMLDDGMQKSRDGIQNSAESISEAKEYASGRIKDPKFRGNSAARFVTRGHTNTNQAFQMVHTRGYTTRINSDLFSKPIIPSYMDGIRNADDFAMESQQSVKATLYQKNPMKIVEYFHRQTHLVIMTGSDQGVLGEVRIGRGYKLLPSKGDCGTTERFEIRIESKKQQNLIAGLIGHSEDNLTPRMIHGSEDLVGKTVYVRTPLNCATTLRGHTCACCLGMYANTVPAGANVGLLSGSELVSEITQKVLGVKHSEGSAELAPLTLAVRESIWLAVGNDRRSIKFRHELRTMRPEVYIKSGECVNLPDIIGHRGKFTTEDMIGQISGIMLSYMDHDTRQRKQIRLNTNQSSTKSKLTPQALEYIRNQNFTLMPNEMYKIDLNDWDWSEPFFELERKHLSMLDLLSQVSAFIKATSDTESKLRMSTLRNIDDKHVALMRFHRLVKDHLRIQFVHLAMAIKATMVRGPRSRSMDFRSPLLEEDYHFGVYGDLMQHRSVGGLMVFEKQHKAMDSLEYYEPGHRPSHVYDEFFVRHGA